MPTVWPAKTLLTPFLPVATEAAAAGDTAVMDRVAKRADPWEGLARFRVDLGRWPDSQGRLRQCVAGDGVGIFLHESPAATDGPANQRVIQSTQNLWTG